MGNTIRFEPETEKELYYFNKLQVAIQNNKRVTKKNNELLAKIDELIETNRKLRIDAKHYKVKNNTVVLRNGDEQFIGITKKALLIKIQEKDHLISKLLKSNNP